MKIERLLAIIVLLLNRRRITAKELAERFEVSIRTIYRDIASLNGAGIPIITSQGYEGGLAIPESYKLSRQLLTPRDLEAMISTLQGVNQGMVHKDLQRIIEMLVSLLPKDDDARLPRRQPSFVVDLTPWGPMETPNQTMQIVQRAVDDTHLLAFSYKDASGRSTSRIVEPHTLIYKGYAWYLLAYCRLRGDFRVFRLSRISGPRLAEGSFLVRDPGDIHRFFQFNYGPSQAVVLRFSPAVRTRVEDSFPGAELDCGEDGYITARLELPDDPWILAFILGLGADAEIIEPDSWRQAVKENLAKMKNLYET
ncbi:YafY family protein [Desulfopila sp. IMCC35008]|uniref:helix-turn-helix transcriptional regulator n=1 Tax=Desulfopila sp. IMCC35008 TaxID=2653858 RepID=UPI0013CF8C6F|nr:YafY family protein [Desulfopila sp. IMCC35008]